jgi:hypothetical protein
MRNARRRSFALPNDSGTSSGSHDAGTAGKTSTSVRARFGATQHVDETSQYAASVRKRGGRGSI